MSFWKRLFGKDITAAQRNAGFETKHFGDRLKNSSISLQAAADRQADAVHDTMASITQIRSMLSQTDAQVNRSLELTEKTRSTGQTRLKTIERMQKAMDGIKESNQLLNDLQEAFRSIHSKTRVINDIVTKTKLLSFNASIEAARAGQFGKGFSVVAEEVGRLAQSSGQAAKEIEHLVMESQMRAVSVVEMVVARANDGVNVSEDVKQSFLEMAASIQEISSSLMSISQASREQMVGIEQTTASIEKINHATLLNKSSADEIMRLVQANLSSTDTPPAPRASGKSPSDEIDSLIRRIEPAKNAQVTPINQVNADDPSFKVQE